MLQPKTFNYNEKESEHPLLTIVNKFLNHRDQLMHNHAAHKSYEKLDALCHCRRQIEFFASNDTQQVCRLILSLEVPLRKLYPGISSKFRRNTVEKMEEIFTYCKWMFSYPRFMKNTSAETYIHLISEKELRAVRVFATENRRYYRSAVEQLTPDRYTELIRTMEPATREEYLGVAKKVAEELERVSKEISQLANL